MIGLCITKDDPLIIGSIRAAIPYLSSLYILDGSSVPNKELAEFIKGVYIPTYIMYDSSIPKIYREPPRDGIRQALFEVIREREKPGQWVYLVHGDEIPWDNPITVAQHADRFNSWVVEWSIVNFLWNENEISKGMSLVPPQNDNLRFEDFEYYVLPAWSRIRQFRLELGYSYDWKGLTEYPSVGHLTKPKVFRSHAIIKHFPLAGTYSQIRQRVVSSIEGNRLRSLAFSWIATLNRHEIEGVFLTEVPEVPGIMEKSSFYKESKFPLPTTYI